MDVTKNQIIAAIDMAGLSKKCVCMHASLKSFGTVDGGAKTVVDAFLEAGCTIITPAFSFKYMVTPPEKFRPKNNGLDYSKIFINPEAANAVFDPLENDVDDDAGAISREVLSREGRVRGKHQLCSFAGIGPFAGDLIMTQQSMDTFAPIKNLIQFDGYLLLMGTGLDKMAAMGYAEQLAGRNLFVRWARDISGKPLMVEIFNYNRGFERFDAFYWKVEKNAVVGRSLWRIFPARKFLTLTSNIIITRPDTTHCGDPACVKCNDAVSGGPLF